MARSVCVSAHSSTLVPLLASEPMQKGPSEGRSTHDGDVLYTIGPKGI